jgi:hypothetical protein
MDHRRVFSAGASAAPKDYLTSCKPKRTETAISNRTAPPDPDFLHAILDRVDHLGASWVEWKTVLEHSIAFHDDALHVIVGVIVQLAAAWVLRRALAELGPWLVVLALELLNEWRDLAWDLWPAPLRSAQVGEGFKDLLLTMGLPTLLMLLARFSPRLFSGALR